MLASIYGSTGSLGSCDVTTESWVCTEALGVGVSSMKGQEVAQGAQGVKTTDWKVSSSNTSTAMLPLLGP